jgi:hypothetical protein
MRLYELGSLNLFTGQIWQFGEKWRKQIDLCILTVGFSDLVNGMLTGFFNSSRELREGDPLSHLLVILVMELLVECF